MIRRVFWLSSGLILGAGGTMWARRRVQSMTRRLQPGRLAHAAAQGAGRRSQGAARHLRGAVEAGRLQARCREDELRRRLGGR